MTDERTFGLSRWEKIRIEAARAAVELIGYHQGDAREAHCQFREFADPIEAWILQADADAEARMIAAGMYKLADEVVARVRGAVGDGVSGTMPDTRDSLAMKIGYQNVIDGVHVVLGTIRPSWSGESPADLTCMQFEWLAAHLAKRGFLGAASMSRQDLIRAYYTDVNGGVFPSARVAGSFEPVRDDLAVNGDGDVVRWDAELPGWRLIVELPGHRIVNGGIMWSPGLWPPMESEA